MKNSRSISAMVRRYLPAGATICAKCLQRQGLPRLFFKSNDRKLEGSCYICGGLMYEIPKIANRSVEQLGSFEFGTFLVGTTVPQEFIDKEDELRANLKIRGKEGIKTQITHSIGRSIASKTGRRVDYSRPDLTLLVYVPENSISITPRAIWISAKYRKTQRGLAQRSSLCKVCNGVGCAACDFKGVNKNSIQAIATEFFTNLFNAESCNFIWLGSEDPQSLVSGDGRPFYVEVLRPKKRPFKISSNHITGQERSDIRSEISIPNEIDLGDIIVSSIKVLESKPANIPQFDMKCRVYLEPIETETSVGQPFPQLIKDQIESEFRNLPIQVRLSRRFKTVTRRIYSVNVDTCRSEDMEAPEGSFALEIACQGGLPIRKFVKGTNDEVVPNLSQFVKGFRIVESRPFDIIEIHPKSVNERRDTEEF